MEIISFSEVRGGSRTAATSKMVHFVIIVNGLKYFQNKTNVEQDTFFAYAAYINVSIKVILTFKVGLICIRLL